LNNYTGYCLSFNQSMGRHIIAGEDEMPLLNRMAEITRLQPSSQNNLPKLLITRSFSEKNFQIIHDSYLGSDKLLPETGWRETDFKLVKIHTHPDVHDAVCCVQAKRDLSCDLVILSFIFYLFYSDLIKNCGLPLHGGLVEYDNRGVVLAGPSGSGKSTCCGRVPKPWNSICDDEVMIIPEFGGNYNLNPVPTWSNYFFNPDSRSTWDVQKCYPCETIFFIEKADNDDAVPIGQGRAAVRIYQSAMESFSRYFAYIPEVEQKKIGRKVFESACELAKNVPAFKLQTSKDGFFWQNIENEINKLNQLIAANT